MHTTGRQRPHYGGLPLHGRSPKAMGFPFPCMQFEEEKTRRRIEETEARAKEVDALRKNHQVFKVDFRIKRQETW